MKATLLGLLVAVDVAAFDQSEFQKQILSLHNKKRALHVVPTLQLNAKLNADALEQASEDANNDKALQVTTSYGRNVIVSTAKEPNPTKLIEFWYAGSTKYNYEEGKHSNTTGTFTQMVWKSSAELGVGAAQSKSGKWYVVALYDPPGNRAKKFIDNVLKPK